MFMNGWLALSLGQTTHLSLNRQKEKKNNPQALQGVAGYFNWLKHGGVASVGNFLY